MTSNKSTFHPFTRRVRKQFTIAKPGEGHMAVGLFASCTVSDFEFEMISKWAFNKISLDCWRSVDRREAGDLSVVRRLSGR